MRGRSEGWSRIALIMFRCPVNFLSHLCVLVGSDAPKQIDKHIKVSKDFTVSRILISNLFCAFLVSIPVFNFMNCTSALWHLTAGMTNAGNSKSL